MKDSFPYEQCFKQFCDDQGVEQEGSNYCHLLEGMLGRRSHLAQDDFRDILSTIESHISDPRHNRDQNNPTELPHNSMCSSIQEEVTTGSASEDALTEEASTSDTNLSTRNTSEEHVSEPLPGRASIQLQELLRSAIEPDDLPKFTQVVMEACTLIREEPVYTWSDRASFPLRLFTCTVILSSLEAVGSECTSKKEAKHQASKVLLELLRARYLE